MKNTHRELVLTVLESAVANVQLNEEKINDLNVFPVPDGDTGSNMLGTLLSAWNNISKASTSDVEILNDFSRGALLGARGNSGVITSQIIKGLSEGVKQVGKLSWDTNEMRSILRSAKEFAYKSVQNPVEGTILSVVRALDEKYDRNVESLQEAFEQVLKIAKEATDNTPNQLSVLKEAGVVDSGAFGLCLLIEGALKAFSGQPLKLGEIDNDAAKRATSFVKADPNKNIGYCTEFILTLKEPDNFDEKSFQQMMVDKYQGDSIVMIKEDDIFKMHIHVKNPGDVFNEAQKYGEFSLIKSENMASQATEAGHFVEGEHFSVNKGNSIKEDELAIVAVSNGEGLNKTFKDAGVNYIVEGGQSMNPSVEDFVKIINELNFKNIVLLPNNSNIILTCNTAKELIKDKNVFVVPTKTLQQGLVALYNINKEMYDFHEYEEMVMDAIANIQEGQITIAVRDTEMNGVKVNKGDFISLSGKEILSSTKDIQSSAKILIDKILDNDVEVISLIYNDEVELPIVDELRNYIKEKNSSIDIERIYGGQQVYHLLIFGEE